MIYSGVHFTCSQTMAEILIAELSHLGFESFTEVEDGLQAYMTEDAKLPRSEILSLVHKYKPIDELLGFKEVHETKQNWNEIWEKSFEPVRIGNQCLVRAPFHPAEDGFDLEIIIEPKMSFGTGHHATTYLMLEELFSIPLTKRQVLDMGCGTSVLAIATSKLGAEAIDAIDIEEWAYENSLENIERNTCSNISVQKGDHNLMLNSYDLILANINKNVLLSHMADYEKHLNDKGVLLVSGFYCEDADAITELAQGLQLSLVRKASRENWCMLHFEKN